MKGLGLAAAAFFLSHVAYHWRFGNMSNALWACHVASLLIGIGSLANVRGVSAIGVLWLTIGIPLWFIHLAMGGDFIPTSILTHGGGAIVGLAVMRHQRWPRGAWWKAMIALATWVAITRYVTSPDLNVNLAFRVPGSTADQRLTHTEYLAVMAGVAMTTFLVADLFLRRVYRSRESLSRNDSADDGEKPEMN